MRLESAISERNAARAEYQVAKHLQCPLKFRIQRLRSNQPELTSWFNGRTIILIYGDKTNANESCDRFAPMLSIAAILFFGRSIQALGPRSDVLWSHRMDEVQGVLRGRRSPRTQTRGTKTDSSRVDTSNGCLMTQRAPTVCAP